MPDASYAILDAGVARVAIGWSGVPRSRSDADNWLTIHAQVRSPDGEWSFRDPSLMVTEMRELIEWLHRAGALSSRTTITFLEPCLAFECGPPSGRNVPLRICFKGEAAPPWLRDDESRWYTGYWADLPVTPAQLTTFAGHLEDRLC